MGLEFVEPAVPRPFEEVKTNVFETAPPVWKMNNSQKGWSQERRKGTREWEARGRDAEIVDSQMEDGSLFKTVCNKEDLQKERRQKNSSRLKMSWKLTGGPLAEEGKAERGTNQRNPEEEKDTEMKEAGRIAEGLADSKHAVKELSEEEIEEMIKEIWLEEEKFEDKDKEMEQEEEEGRSDLLNAPHDSRNVLGLINSILKNNEVVEEFKALPNKKKWWKPAKDANLAKRLILAARDVIEGRY